VTQQVTCEPVRNTVRVAHGSCSLPKYLPDVLRLRLETPQELLAETTLYSHR
jgi:hypothetical protein